MHIHTTPLSQVARNYHAELAIADVRRECKTFYRQQDVTRLERNEFWLAVGGWVAATAILIVFSAGLAVAG